VIVVFKGGSVAKASKRETLGVPGTGLSKKKVFPDHGKEVKRYRGNVTLSLNNYEWSEGGLEERRKELRSFGLGYKERN